MSAAAARASGKATPTQATGKLMSSSLLTTAAAASGKLTPASGILSDMPEQERPIDLSIRSEDETTAVDSRSCSPADSFESDIEVSAY